MAIAALIAASLCHAAPAAAAPTLAVRDGGVSGGNQLWIVEVSPDASLFEPIGTTDVVGSMAVELDFSVSGSTIVSVTKNSAAWPADNPGMNPFTGAATCCGIAATSTTAFVALGSQLITTGAPLQVVTLQTQGTGPTTLSWGNQTVLPGSPQQYLSSRIAQTTRNPTTAQNFDGIQGRLTLNGLTADFDADGDVDGTDFSTWQSQFGLAIGATRALGDADADADVDGSDFLAWQRQTGRSAGGAVPIPEPASALLLCAAAGLAWRLVARTSLTERSGHYSARSQAPPGNALSRRLRLQ